MEHLDDHLDKRPDEQQEAGERLLCARLPRSNSRVAVVRALRDANQWVSGEALAAQIGITRAAVGHHVTKLRRQGYVIKGIRSLGYRMLYAPPDPAWLELQPTLTTRYLGRTGFFYFATTPSTNEEARRLALYGAPSGTVVVADEQTAGRGRKGRSWASPAGGGLYISMILKTGLPVDRQTLIPLAASVAIAESIEAVAGLKPRIKWPNDVLVEGRKVGGILTERVGEFEGSAIVLGIGINVNTDTCDLPERPLYPSGSLCEPLGEPVSRGKLLAALLDRIEFWIQKLIEGADNAVRARWTELSCTLGQQVRIDQEVSTLEGIAVGISDGGALLVIDGNGTRVEVSSGDLMPLGTESD